MDLTISLEDLSAHLQRSAIDDLEVYERFVNLAPGSWVRELHDFEAKQGLIAESVFTTSPLQLAIMTYIALGNELGNDLESEFPEYRAANPLYSKCLTA
ncbi:hypothetical protein NTH44_003320 [Vibrio metoecus]